MLHKLIFHDERFDGQNWWPSWFGGLLLLCEQFLNKFIWFGALTNIHVGFNCMDLRYLEAEISIILVLDFLPFFHCSHIHMFLANISKSSCIGFKPISFSSLNPGQDHFCWNMLSCSGLEPGFTHHRRPPTTTPHPTPQPPQPPTPSFSMPIFWRYFLD